MVVLPLTKEQRGKLSNENNGSSLDFSGSHLSTISWDSMKPIRIETTSYHSVTLDQFISVSSSLILNNNVHLLYEHIQFRYKAIALTLRF